MSQELLSTLNQEAISRMGPYELVERAIGLRSEMYDDLGIEPVELGNGDVLYTVTSGLVATHGIHRETILEGDELIRRQFMPMPMTAFADVVELRPPAGHNDGDARLYRIEEPVEVLPAEVRKPFQDTAMEIMTNLDPVSNTWSPIRFDGISNTFYHVDPTQAQSDEMYMSSGDRGGYIPLMANSQTRVHLETIGKDELDRELGVLATVSGPALLALDKRQLVRVTSTGVFYGPSENKTVEICIPSDTPQHNLKKFHRIPDDATVAPNEVGYLVPMGDRAHDSRYESTRLNPNISPATLISLLPPGAIDWNDGTKAFIHTLSDRINRIMPLSTKGYYEQALQTARYKILEAMTDNRRPVIGHAGCLAVAARLAELPVTIHGTYAADAKFFERRS